MKFRAVWGKIDNEFKPVLWIGPVENLAPEPRKQLDKMDKQQMLRDQDYKCNLCENKIKLWPVSTGDADHILPINIGGKTLIDNMQLLCVCCHREKSARELNCLEKTMITDYNIGSKDVLIGKSLNFKFPLEKMTPKEVIESEMDELCLLTYKKTPRIKNKQEINYIELLNKFRFKPESFGIGML